ncbi:threonine synthase [Companilactobacillus nantensis]|uniref:Threonine synthase n=1 Tax=Companilactobacillus nantensis DSM 16982 TaxID=1423774 RepID=A0A0R1WKM3_9LACO|nr:threonine synthase [Companilactobacillus nantensis]KRM18077.1 threonine synthase [Companilactobacillus nantensis DSM 16982]GEO63718.1 threonine synthase [Companilactobacillus nantensis]
MNNNYTSTRSQKIQISAKEAIKKGFADDGGLFVYPELSNLKINLEAMKGLNYQEIAQIVLEKLLPDFSAAEIQASIENAYDHSFDTAKITPLVSVNNFHVLELFHGPTSAFKDIGLQMLPQLMKRVLKKNNQVMILTATSGDTGKAALEGFKNLDQTAITVFYPHNGVSKVQQLQMETTSGNNTEITAIKGNFDDAQSNVKKIFNDQALKQKLGKNISLSSANSINIGRLIPQVVYYFDAYFQLVEQKQIKLGQKVNFTVPTGNFGDVLAGFYAKQMGLPVNKFIVASNANNVLTKFFNTGIYNRNIPFLQTDAPSMDIQISSNFERLLYYKSNEDTDYVQKLMSELEQTGSYQVSAPILDAIKEDFYCGFATDQEIETTIKNVYQNDNYLMDPHTAVGYKVMRDYQTTDPDTPTILLSTASPYKFVHVVTKAVLNKSFDDDHEAMQQLQQFTQLPIPKNLAQVWDLPILHQDVINQANMTDYVLEKVEDHFHDKN